MLLGIAYAASIEEWNACRHAAQRDKPVGSSKRSWDGHCRLSIDGVAFPIVVILLPIVWLWMTRGLSSDAKFEMPDVGRWRSSEVRVLIVFGLTAVAWITRTTSRGWLAGVDACGFHES
ncbi:MAG: hypothetical protein R3C05_29705 [Pirellulaceae bacterium]